MNEQNAWNSNWGPTCPGVLTVHDVCGGWSALAHGSGRDSAWIRREEHERLAALFASTERLVLAASREVELFKELSQEHQVGLRLADEDLPSPLRDSSRAESPVRWLASHAASFALGGSCVAIHSHGSLDLDLVDGSGRYCGGSTVVPDADIRETKRALDDAIRALVSAEGECEGPWLVLSGWGASELVGQGGLPMTVVPDMLHHGLVELWRSTQDG